MKILIYIWLITLFMDNLLPLLLARFYPNYEHKEMALSVLGSRQSSVRWIYNVWCILSGIVFCITPYALYQENNNGLAVAIWILLAIYGVGCEIISGFCPLNENRQEDMITKIHGGASAVGFTTLLVVPLLLAILHFQVSEIVVGLISLLCFIAAFVFFCFFIMGEKEKFAKTILRYGGIWQRLILVCCYVPLAVWCVLR
ncbi:DUF998 domain-containing protein [Blautia obeum]|uniref:DUF998 domain-containing protein n=1 Tax=Blautia obeum A2-162 TaxID=657314 RepID=D4LYF8_9FIRM|nr:DUF998 domain-containing protein [Blautia obeum]CBL22661.1 Protein of unknown function (DUF998) [Blautia obeum A2-162]